MISLPSHRRQISPPKLASFVMMNRMCRARISALEVTDVDEAYARAVEQGIEIVYPLTDEPWGVRRFFAVDPNGAIINIVSHR